MNERDAAAQASAKKPFKWIARSALVLSLTANAGLIAKIVVFDPAIPFRPLCLSRQEGLVVMKGLMREKYKAHVLTNLNYRISVDKDGTIYISRWDWWRDKDGIWNLSRQIAERLHRERTGIPRPVSGLTGTYPGAHTCRFISTYAIE